MAGIFDDPQAQGILQAAFAGLAASGPSRMPVSIGQVIGQAGTAGINAMEAQKKQQAALAMAELQRRKLAADAEKAEADLKMQREIAPLVMGGEGSGILGGGANPDVLEALGQKLALAGHPTGAALIGQAEKIRAKREKDAQFKLLQSTETTIQPDPQEVEQAADQGLLAPEPSTVKKGGIFSTLASSPYVGEEARLLQSQVDAAEKADPQDWIKRYERLRNAHTKAQEKEAAEQLRRDTEPLVAVLKDGKPVMLPRSQAVGLPPANQGAVTEIVPVAHKDMHGDDYLATLPSGMASLVKSIAEGKVDPSKAASMRYGNREAIMQRVLQYDPAYNAQRPKVWQDFTSGKTAQNITAINTVIAHMGTVNELTEALKNKNVQAVNAITNRLRTELGKPEINNAEIAIQAMGNELMRVFRQVGAAQHEVESWEKKFNAAKGSPEQLKGALRVGAELVKGRLDAVNDQWKRGMQTEQDFPQIISPKSRGVLQRMGLNWSENAPAGPFSDPDKERRYQEWKAKQGK